MTSGLIADGLTKRYGRRVALQDYTLDIPAGHVVGLVGPNGAGKSTRCSWPAGCSIRPPGGSRCSASGRSAGPPGSGSSHRTPRSMPASPSRTTCGWARTSTRPGTVRSPSGGSHRSAWIGTEGAQALRRPARPARTRHRRREATRATAARRAGGGTRPARPAPLPAGADGADRRAGHEHRDVLAPCRRPGTGLRLPDRTGRLSGAGGRRRGRPVCHPPPPGRAPTRQRRPGRRAGLGRAEPHRRAVNPGGTQHRTHRRPVLAGRPAGPGGHRAGVRERSRRQRPDRVLEGQR